MDIKTYVDALQPLISFKSISSDDNLKDEMKKTALWLKAYFLQNGYDSSVYELPVANPLVFAEYKVSAAAKTVLLYGHYDVVTADDQEGWRSNPYQITEKDGYLFARGIVDDKGQFFIHLHAISQLIKEKKLAINVKVILEGNEEVENPDLENFIKENQTLLASDLVLISDGPGIGNLPTLEASLRAGFDMTLTYTTTKAELHSGIYGGGIPNAANEMILLLSKLIGENNQVMVPGFYDDVDKVTDGERASCEKLVPDEVAFAESLGLKKLLLQPGNSFYVQTGLQPDIQVSGIISGHTNNGYGTTIPNQAMAKIEVRLVKSQNPEKMRELVTQYIKMNTPNYVELDVVSTDAGIPVKVDVTKPIFQKIQQLIQDSYGSSAYVRYVGGSIPVVASFQEILKTEPVVLSLGNEDSNEHGANENLNIEVLHKAYDFSYNFFSSTSL